MTLYPVIMAGGSGTRFWPLSRKAKPKQFLPLTSSRPLIDETARRLSGLASMKNAYVVCGPVHEKSVRAAVKGLPRSHVVVEPIARNTAAAIALAAMHVAHVDPAGTLLVLPSDHHIADVPTFQRVLSDAARIAADGHLVTIGIRPHRPETGYGYIRCGGSLPGGALQVRAFVEKPNLEKAREYLSSGEYLWNGGIFVFRADSILTALERHMPALSKGLAPVRAAIGSKRYPAVLKKVFPKVPSESIDYGVMEKADNIAVVPGDFGWSDVGSFAALPEVRSADTDGNVVEGKGAMVIDCHGCVVMAGTRPLAVIGMNDVVVIDAGDSVLVVPKDKSQDVRKAVESLKRRKLERYL